MPVIKMLGRVVDDLLAHLFGRLEHRAAADVGGAAGIGAGVKGREVGVAGVDDDLLQRHAQRLGRDLAQHRVRAGAQVGGAR